MRSEFGVAPDAGACHMPQSPPHPVLASSSCIGKPTRVFKHQNLAFWQDLARAEGRGNCHATATFSSLLRQSKIGQCGQPILAAVHWPLGTMCVGVGMRAGRRVGGWAGGRVGGWVGGRAGGRAGVCGLSLLFRLFLVPLEDCSLGELLHHEYLMRSSAGPIIRHCNYVNLTCENRRSRMQRVRCVDGSFSTFPNSIGRLL